MKLVRLFFLCLPLLLTMHSLPLSADPAGLYRQAIELSAQGKEREAVASLHAASEVLPDDHPWQQRMRAAALLIRMKMVQRTEIAADGNMHIKLAQNYVQSTKLPAAASTWPVVAAATLVPGAGHALLGRWSDASTAALMVWPMLILTLWAARRRMGPVTVFFTLITIWLWSGTVFSSISLMERGDLEQYLNWWQGLWQASGLPGRPW